MANLVRWARRSSPSPWPSITIDQLPYWFGQFGYQGLGYGPQLIQTIQQNRETIAADFTGYVNGAFKTNGAVFALIAARMFLLSEARFQFRRMNNGRPGKLFGTADLELLERPWPNATTGDLISKVEVDYSLAGNFYAIKAPRQDRTGMKIARLRPDWVTIVKGSVNEPDLQAWDPTAELVGYVYTPGGHGSGLDPITYLPHECMHFAPIPDPVATYRGMSWLQPVLTEVLGDRAMNTHKQMYFENGASPNLVVSMDTGKMDKETFDQWIDAFEAQHEGAINAYKTLYLGQGADAKVVGANLKDLDYAITQGHGETRMAAASGMPAIIVGFSEGLEAATYSNFNQARRLCGDKTLRPWWRNLCSSLETLVPPPPGSALWYDDRDIPFLKDDQAEIATIQQTQAAAIRQLVDAGYDPDSIVDAITANDLQLLTHSGLYSVQLRPPGGGPPTSPTDPQTVMPGQPVPQPSQGGQQGQGQGNGKPQLPAATSGSNGQSSG